MKFFTTKRFPYIEAQLTLSTSFVFASILVMLVAMLIFVFYKSTPGVSPCYNSRTHLSHGNDSTYHQVVKPHAKRHDRSTGTRHHVYYINSYVSASDNCQLTPGQKVTIDVLTTPSQPAMRVQGRVVDTAAIARRRDQSGDTHRAIIAVGTEDIENKPESLSRFIRSIPAKAKIVYTYSSPFEWVRERFAFHPS